MLRRLASNGFLALLVVGASPGLAHENAVLKSPQSAVAAGRALTLSGSDFEEGQTYQLKLVGALNEHELRPVTASSEGTFSIEVEIPATVRAGQYRLVAIAPDGDDVAGLDVTILEAASAAAEPDGARGREASNMPRAEEMPIERSRSGVEWGLIGLVIGLAGGLGIGLVRRA